MKIDPGLKEDLKKHLQQRMAQQGTTVVIMAPYALDREEIQEIREKIPVLRNAQIEQEVDKNLLGGFVIKFGSKMIDLSLRTELQKLQQRLYEII